MYDKISALEKLGKYKKMFTEKIEHSGKLETENKVTIVSKIEDYEELFNGENKKV